MLVKDKNINAESCFKSDRKKTVVKSSVTDSSCIPKNFDTDIYIDFECKGKRRKLKTQFIGYSKDEYLIVKTPIIDDTFASYKSNDNIAVRYVCEGRVFGFQAKIIKTMDKPFHLTFLNHPGSFEEIKLRRHIRVPLVLQIERRGGDPSTECILNLSSSGALIRLCEYMPIDKEFNISFIIPSGIMLDNISCTVRRIDEKLNKFLVGIEFDTNHRQYSHLEKYVNMLIDSQSTVGNV